MRASRTASVTGDEPFYLLTAQSLVSDADLDLRDEYAGHEERHFWDGSIPLWKQMQPTESGRLLAPHEPGLPLLIAPAYALGGLRGAQRFLVVLWSLAIALAAATAVRLGAPTAAAALGGTAVGAGTPGIVYASQIYPEAAAALCVASLLFLAQSAKPRPLLAAGALVGMAWLGAKYIPVGAVLALIWLWRHRGERRAVTAVALVCAVAAAHYVWWHLATFGGLTTYGTNVVWAGEGTAEILEDHIRVSGRGYRPWALFLDARFGLLRWSPIVVLAMWGVRRRAGAQLAVVAVSVLVASFASITIMGWWFPGRMLIVALPALTALVALGIPRVPRASALLALWSLVIASALVWAARQGRVTLAVDPFGLGFPLAPAWLFPDFRRFGVAETTTVAAWVAGLTMLLWRSSSSSTATLSPTAPSLLSPPTWPPPRDR